MASPLEIHIIYYYSEITLLELGVDDLPDDDKKRFIRGESGIGLRSLQAFWSQYQPEKGE